MFEIKENMIYDKSELIQLFGSETTLYRATLKGLKLRKPTGGKIFCLGSELMRFFSESEAEDVKKSDVIAIGEKHRAKIDKTLAQIARA